MISHSACRVLSFDVSIRISTMRVGLAFRCMCTSCTDRSRPRIGPVLLCHYWSSWPSCSGVFGTGHAHLYPVVCFATSATRRSICGTFFDSICVKPPSSSTTMTTVSSVTLLWLTTVSLILRRLPIMCCAVVGCIMPWFACCLWPTITHCMNVRFSFEALQLLFCSFFRSGYINCLVL